MRLTSLLVVLGLMVVGAIFLLRDLPPPHHIVFAAGNRDGGYWNFAEKYREILARDGIEVEILETAGSLENLDMLAMGRADVGLLQGGIPAAGLPIEALGTVFAEPVVVYANAGSDVPANPGLWSGLTIARGAVGSGTQVAVTTLLESLGVAEKNLLVDIGGGAATEALLAGEIDLAIFVAPFSAAYLEPLIGAEGVRFVRLDHVDAVELRLPHSRVAVLPSGALSLDPVVPPVPVPMVVLMARLAAAENLHPAVVDRLVLAARQIHGANGILSRQGQFPNAEAADMPIDAGALKLLAEGQSPFHAWLPYWIAAQIRRVLLVVVPLFFVVIPLIRILPAVYRWSMHRRVWRYYNEIRLIEMELSTVRDENGLDALAARLAALDDRLAAMRLPPAFRGGAYDARLHLDLVRRHIADRRDAVTTP